MALKKYGDTKAYSYRIYEPVSTDHEVKVTNCLAINDRNTTDKKNKDGSWKEGENGKNGIYGRFEIDSTLTNYSIVTSEFRYASPDQFVDIENHAELIAPRQADGSLPEAPKLWINPEIKDFYDFTPDDLKLIDYETGPQIKFPVAV